VSISTTKVWILGGRQSACVQVISSGWSSVVILTSGRDDDRRKNSAVTVITQEYELR
jgi:hypothetical protein